jgi:hypothetical protein
MVDSLVGIFHTQDYCTLGLCVSIITLLLANGNITDGVKKEDIPVQPHYEWIILWIIFRENQPIVKISVVLVID